MLKKFRKSEKGFTLIELLIVVAIIGILAAIAIPQFAAYRIRAFNGAGNADLKNARTAQEALFADFQTYGKTESNVLLDANLSNNTGVGGVVAGPMPAATTSVNGCALSGPRNSDGAPVGVGTGLSNGVVFIASSSAAPGGVQNGSASFIMGSKHTQGNRVFAGETEGTAIFFVENPDWAGFTLNDTTNGPATAFGLLNAAPTVNAEIDGTVAAGGTPIANWSAQ